MGVGMGMGTSSSPWRARETVLKFIRITRPPWAFFYYAINYLILSLSINLAVRFLRGVAESGRGANQSLRRR